MKNWNVFLALITLAFASQAMAEDFTMTRGYDGKVFYCQDGQGQQPGQGTVTQCSCYSPTYGDFGTVLGDDALTQCKTISSNAGQLRDCKGLPVNQNDNLTCECYSSTYGSYGQVIAPVRAVGTLSTQCKNISSSSGHLRNCAVLH